MHEDLLIEESIVRRRLPLNLNPDDLHLFSNELEKTIASVKCLRYQNIVGCPNGVLIQSGSLVPESLAIPNMGFFSNLKLYLKCISRNSRPWNSQRFDQPGIWVTDNWSSGYFHWVADALPRLWVMRKYLAEATLLLPGELKDFDYIKESLKPFQIKDVIFLDKATTVKNLLLASHVAPTGNYNEKVMQSIRELFLKYFLENNTGANERVYVSRAKAAKRKIVNESEVADLLIKYGFKTVYFEDISFKEQVNISRRTKYFISNHGAGMTNIMFMQPGANVLEFRKINDFQNNCYFSLASALNLNYFYQLCKPENSNEFTHTANLIVDLKQLEMNVKLMLS